MISSVTNYMHSEKEEYQDVPSVNIRNTADKDGIGIKINNCEAVFFLGSTFDARSALYQLHHQIGKLLGGAE